MTILPTWGTSSQMYEAAVDEAARTMGMADWPSPVLPYLDHEGRVLDIGCGTGHTARLLAQRGCSVVGVELDEAAAVMAAAWCEKVVVCDLDVTDLRDKLDGDTFDTIVAADVLEHLRDPVAVLQTLTPLLRPGGRVLVSVPNVAHGSVRLALMTGRFDYNDIGILDRTHLRFFTVHSVQQLFAAAGYAVEQLERFTVPVPYGEPYESAALPEGVEAAVAAMPESTTYEFIVIARPTPETLANPPDRPPQASGRGDGPEDDPDERSTDGADRAVTLTDLPEAKALREKDRQIIDLRGQLTELADLRAQVVHKQLELDMYRHELDEIGRSKVWRLWVKVRPVLHKALRRR
ncbi:MAG: class I SAM-dependent methyltransferase [Acidimicrobiia bacterium]